MICVVCGGTEFTDMEVLWPSLIVEWGLSLEETHHINRQQGTHCTQCNASLRANALAMAILSKLGTEHQTLRNYVSVDSTDKSSPKILDLNGCATVSETLSVLPNYIRADYPDEDMQALSFADGTFDLVIHSDTLEHIPRPVDALRECRRVLAPNGSLCFTIPMLAGRLSKSRAGLAPSYHGNAQERPEDHLVHTEFGADSWLTPIRAGFKRVEIFSFEDPSAFAFAANVS